MSGRFQVGGVNPASRTTPAERGEAGSLLALAPNAWEGQWVNRQQLLSRLARRRRILYSTGTWFSWERTRPEWQRAPWWGAFDSRDSVTLDRPGRLYTRLPACPPLDRWSVRCTAQRWQRWLDEARSARTAYLFHPSFVPYLSHLRVERVVYHAYDLYRAAPGWTAALAQFEDALLERAGLVIASSEAIAEQLGTRREVRVLPNGADVAAFERALAGPMPADLETVPKPRLGYIGSLHPQVDLARIARLATLRPDWQFVLVGARVREIDAQAAFSACESLGNVHFLGARARHEVAAYTAHMDVNLLCYRTGLGAWTDVGYPLKLHEYFAVGHPVVSADLAVVRAFEPVVRVVPDDDEAWVNAIEHALAECDEQANAHRRRIARENDWAHRAVQLERWLDEPSFDGSSA